MKKKRSNLPENVLPENNSFNTAYDNHTNWDPLHIETDYMSPRELKRQEKLMKRKSRKDKKHNKKENKSQNYNDNQTRFKTNTTLEPRTDRQADYLDILNDQNVHIVFGVGPAGTGKTYIATKWAALALQQGLFDKIVITRPVVSVGEKLGYLPGTLEEKMNPILLPILDVLEEVFGRSQVESLIKLGAIEIAPLAFMRGRSFKNCLVLLDEAQNTTVEQFRMFLTRIGENSKMIVTGDMKQSDFQKENGLSDFFKRLKKTEGIEMIKFDNSDIQRHHLIGAILEMYGEED